MPQCSHKRLATLMNFVRHHHIGPDRIYNRWFYSRWVTLFIWFIFLGPNNLPTSLRKNCCCWVHKESLTAETIFLLPRFLKIKTFINVQHKVTWIWVVSNKTKRGRSNFIVWLKCCWWECIHSTCEHQTKQSYIHLLSVNSSHLKPACKVLTKDFPNVRIFFFNFGVSINALMWWFFFQN